ncbi:flagellar protein FliT [Paraburkholderia sp. BCC1884]|uniref:flagellar protein FliT n=1 Tax=Paraburkholderia sp. BCC1884 TaxID=2562668 RepID=UPI0011829157|nr:flagellar protein FliT [Paraburkholderia sp. BCC1884]
MEQATQVEQILALTREIEHAAALADWPEAARLVEVRSPMIMSLDAQQVQGSLDAIRSVVARDAVIFADAQSTQAELQSEFNSAIRRVNAVGQYHKTALMAAR